MIYKRLAREMALSNAISPGIIFRVLYSSDIFVPLPKISFKTFIISWALCNIARSGIRATLSKVHNSNQTCATSVRPVPAPRGDPSTEVVHSGWMVYSSEYCGSSSSAVGTVTSLLMTETVREGTWSRGNSEPSFCLMMSNF